MPKGFLLNATYQFYGYKTSRYQFLYQTVESKFFIKKKVLNIGTTGHVKIVEMKAELLNALPEKKVHFFKNCLRRTEKNVSFCQGIYSELPPSASFLVPFATPWLLFKLLRFLPSSS